MLARIFSFALGLVLLAGSSVAAQVASPSPSPTPSSLPIPFRLGGAGRVLFILATGGDSPTQQKMVSLLTRAMELSERAYTAEKTDLAASLVTVVPEPAWQPADYATACVASFQGSNAANSAVAGALIIGIDQVSTYTKSAIIFRDNHTLLDATLFYSRCVKQAGGDTPKPAQPMMRYANAQHVTEFEPPKSPKKTVTDYVYATPTPDPNTPPTTSPYYIEWKTTDKSNDGYARIWTPLQGISILMSGLAAWATLTPSVTKGTTNTTVYSTPIPGNPIPPEGVVTQSMTSNSKQTNASQFGTFAGGFFTSSLSYENAVTAPSTADWQTYNAAYYVTRAFANQMSCPKSTSTPATQPAGTSPSPSPSPTPPCLKILLGNDV